MALALAACVAPVPPTPPVSSPTAASSPAVVATAMPEVTPTAQPTPRPVPTIGPDPLADPGVTCDPGSGLAFPLRAIVPVAAEELAPDAAADALRSYLASDGGLMPDQGWSRVIQTPVGAVFVARDTEPGKWVFVSVTAGADSWGLDAVGACALQTEAPAGFTVAEWDLDPTRPPHAADRVVTVLASETACASGKPPGDRMQPPTVAVRAETVVITIMVRHRPGGQDCPGNPIVPVRVDLGQPLGDRRLVDGSDLATLE